jgi:competence ComEA-like helix-hairpin-helix protein
MRWREAANTLMAGRGLVSGGLCRRHDAALSSCGCRISGSVLVGLLWCLALLSVVVIGVLHTARIDLLIVKNHGDRIQAQYLALAGIEKAKALLYQDARERSRSRVNHSDELYNSPQEFRDIRLGRGQFQVFHRGRADEGGIIYGVSDEESRLNVNTASGAELAKLDGMTPDLLAAISDWRDGDNAATSGGAEVDYYASLQPPYQPRNGPLLTLRELLMVRGITPELLGDSPSQAGWSAILTVDSSVENVNAAGENRINIQTADEPSLTSIRGISQDIAKAIVSYRGQNRLETLADLLDVVAAQNQPQQERSSGTNQPSQGRPIQSAPPPNPSGPKVVSEDLLMEIADDLTADSNQDLPGAVNINTASLDVLACLPGIDRELAQAIISFRHSDGFFPNTAWLLKVPGMNRQIFKQLAPRVTARSETYRILSEGKVNSSGARQRIQAIVRVGLGGIETLSYREDDL